MRYQLEAGAPREMFDNRGVGIPSKSKASSSELVDGYDLAQKFEYLPDDSVDSVRQQVVSPFLLKDYEPPAGSLPFPFKDYQPWKRHTFSAIQQKNINT